MKNIQALFVVVIAGLFLSACTTNTAQKVTPQIPQPTTQPSPNTTKTESTTQPVLNMAEVGTHATPENCWTVIEGTVYDLTPFIGKHKGGPIITKICGKDGTELFSTQHGQEQLSFAKQFKLGELVK